MIRICLLVCMSLLTLMSGSQAKAAERPYGMAGCGVFGIGILVLPNAQGKKELHTGPFSQGMGMAGVGADPTFPTPEISTVNVVESLMEISVLETLAEMCGSA